MKQADLIRSKLQNFSTLCTSLKTVHFEALFDDVYVIWVLCTFRCSVLKMAPVSLAPTILQVNPTESYWRKQRMCIINY